MATAMDDDVVACIELFCSFANFETGKGQRGKKLEQG